MPRITTTQLGGYGSQHDKDSDRWCYNERQVDDCYDVLAASVRTTADSITIAAGLLRGQMIRRGNKKRGM